MRLIPTGSTRCPTRGRRTSPSAASARTTGRCARVRRALPRLGNHQPRLGQPLAPDQHQRDRARTGHPFSDLHIITPGYPSGQEFTNAYLEDFRPFTSIRSGAWTKVINSKEVNWSDRHAGGLQVRLDRDRTLGVGHRTVQRDPQGHVGSGPRDGERRLRHASRSAHPSAARPLASRSMSSTATRTGIPPGTSFSRSGTRPRAIRS